MISNPQGPALPVVAAQAAFPNPSYLSRLDRALASPAGQALLRGSAIASAAGACGAALTLAVGGFIVVARRRVEPFITPLMITAASVTGYLFLTTLALLALQKASQYNRGPATRFNTPIDSQTAVHDANAMARATQTEPPLTVTEQSFSVAQRNSLQLGVLHNEEQQRPVQVVIANP